MGAYHDIDPSVNSGTDISWAVLGSSPCRTFVVNYHNVAHFSCNSEITTQQIILYETTNIIEVYIHDKPTCNSWNDGNAVIGIQNSNGSQGIAAPGRNTGPWTANNEAWRFTPSGPPNWAVSWFNQSGSLLGTGLTLNNVSAPGTTTYTAEVVYTNCDGTTMTLTDDVVVEKITNYTSSFSFEDELCFNSCDGSIEVSTTGGSAPFTYDIGSGPQTSAIFNGLCQGVYNITITDDDGCTDQITVVVGGPSEIEINAADTLICLTGTATLNPSITGGSPPYSFLWSTGETSPTITVSPVSGQTYCLTVTDDSGCTSANICMDVDVGQELEVDAGIDQTICLGESITLSAIGSGGNGSYSFLWNQGLGAGQSQTITPTEDTTYMVVLFDACETPSDTDYVFVEVITPPTIDFFADQRTGCAPLTVKFTGNGIPADATCFWEFGDGSTSTDYGFTSYTYTAGGCFSVKLTITTADGCTVQLEYIDYICPDAQPVAGFNWSPKLPSIFNSEVRLNNISQGAVSYEWTISVDGTISTFNTDNVRFTFPSAEPGTYPVCLIATNASGCADTICHDIRIVDDVHVFIPNAFTPNGDGLNDFFVPVLSTYDVTNYEFRIFDRWGQELFYSDRQDEAWDGKKFGDTLPIGVYVWMIRLRKEWNNEWKDLKGHVTIVR